MEPSLQNKQAEAAVSISGKVCGPAGLKERCTAPLMQPPAAVRTGCEHPLAAVSLRTQLASPSETPKCWLQEPTFLKFGLTFNAPAGCGRGGSGACSCAGSPPSSAATSAARGRSAGSRSRHWDTMSDTAAGHSFGTLQVVPPAQCLVCVRLHEHRTDVSKIRRVHEAVGSQHLGPAIFASPLV